MSDNDLSINLGFVTDQASIDKAKRAINDTRDAMLKATEAIKSTDEGKDSLMRAARAYEALGADAKEASQASQLAARAIADTESAALQRTAEGYQNIEKAARGAADAAESVSKAGGARRAAEGFDSVGASGDIASSTGGIRSALDALGVASDSAAGRVLELAEAAGDFGEYGPILARTIGDLASKGGPATSAAFNALSGQIGATGAKAAIAGASIGLAAGALAILSLAVQKLQQDAAAAQKGISEAFSARDKTNSLRDSGATESAAKQRAAQVARELQTARDEEALARSVRDRAFKELQASNGDLKARVADATGYFSSFNERIEETSKRVADLAAEYSDLNGAINKGEFTKDMAAVGDAVNKQAAASAAAASAIEQTTGRQMDVTASAFQYDEALLAQHLANEGTLKASAYEQQIAMVAQAADAVANGYRPLNMSGARGGTMSGFSVGGLRALPNAPYVRRDALGNTTNSRTINNQPVINIQGVTNTNEMKVIVLEALHEVHLID
jgi:hypothetical protein